MEIAAQVKKLREEAELDKKADVIPDDEPSDMFTVSDKGTTWWVVSPSSKNMHPRTADYDVSNPTHSPRIHVEIPVAPAAHAADPTGVEPQPATAASAAAAESSEDEKPDIRASAFGQAEWSSILC